MPPPALSVVIPAYNEAACIARTVAVVRAELDRLLPEWELVVVDDGSTDGTPRIARETARDDPRIRVIEAAHAGKGAAVRQGMLASSGTWRVLADADLSTPIAELARFLPAEAAAGFSDVGASDAGASDVATSDAGASDVEVSDVGAAFRRPETPPPDLVIGSREITGARRIDEPWRRHVIGRVFTWWVKLLMLRGIEDTQCGFKLFRGDVAESLFRRQRLNGFGFDVEVLFLARRAGLTIRQLPVTWTYKPDSKVTVWSGLGGFLDVLRVRWNAATGVYAGIDASGPRVMTWLVGAIMAASVAWSVLGIPIQTTDSIVPILQAQEAPSVVDAVKRSLFSTAFLRPLRIGQIQVLYELAAGTDRYFLVFRGFHVLLVVAAFALFIQALRVRTREDALVATFALTVFTGLHTFLGTVWEAYPINHFLEIAVFCLLALVLAQSRGGWWADVLAAATFVVASLTLESGLLVWVVLVAARLAGMRGVSRSGIIAVTVLLAGYMYLRFGLLATGTPTLVERSSGFWTERFEPDELIRRFGERPAVFYAYNVLSSFSSVLFSEPRAGVFAIPGQWRAGELIPGTLMNVLSSAATTLFIIVVVLRRWREWLHGRFSRTDQLVFVMCAVLLGNSAISYGYTKDDTMSAAGVFYALAAFAGVREAVAWASTRRHVATVLLALVLTATASAWVVRTVGLHYHMRWMAYTARNEWVHVDRWLEEQEASPRTPEGRRIVDTLRQDAIDRPAMNRYFMPRWAERWFQ